MFFHSIRWRLQLWHGLVLVLVLAGFGFTAHRLDRVSRLQRIDRELQRRATVVAGALRRPGPPGRPPDGADPLFEPRGGPQPPDDTNPHRFRDRTPPDSPPPRPRRSGEEPPQPGFHLNERDLTLFEGDATNAYYFVVWHREGRELSRSDSAPENVSRPAASGGENFPRLRGDAREFVLFTPPGECILTGRDIGGELGEMRRLAWLLAVAGGGVLLLGLAGGWWFSTRAIRPIKDISATAIKISTGDLSQRIPTPESADELGQLASVLNSTFTRLEASFAQQARFTSDAAHELRTPLSVMLAQTQSTLNRERTAPEYRETLEACQRAAQRMRRLTESLLELARLDAGAEITRKRLDLAAAAQSGIEMVNPLADQKRIAIRANLEEANCLGDLDQLTLVVTNLLSNAVHYNREGGEIHVTTRHENRNAILTVKDNGLGIAAEDLPLIFERFYRADKSRSQADGRMGLGLAITKSIVEKHGGKIDVESKHDSGTTFTIRLPLN